MNQILIPCIALLFLGSCKDCQICTKTIGGVAGNVVMEEKEVCNDAEASALESSSSGTTVWKCEEE